MILHLEFSVTFFKCDYAKLHLKTPNYSTFCVNTAFRKMANIYALKHQNTLIFFIHRLLNKSIMLHYFKTDFAMEFCVLIVLS